MVGASDIALRRCTFPCPKTGLPAVSLYVRFELRRFHEERKVSGISLAQAVHFELVFKVRDGVTAAYWQRLVTMDARLYRERSTGRRPGKPTVLELWTCLVGRDNALAGKESQQGGVPVKAIEAAVVVE